MLIYPKADKANVRVFSDATAVLLVLALLICGVMPFLDSAQWNMHDFKLFYKAAQDFVRGGDPYQTMLTLGPYDLYYMYSPLTLYFFLPFTWFSFHVACLAFLILKVAALAILLMIWSRFFLGRPRVWFWLFCVISFNSTLYIDFQVGNIEVIQQLLIWSGLACFVSERYRAFCTFIIIAALFKITPILLLGLMLLRPQKKNTLLVLIWPFTVFVGLLLISMILEPSWLSRLYIEIGRNAGGPAPYNQSFLNLVRDVFRPYIDPAASRHWPMMLFMVFASIIMGTTAYVYRIHRWRDQAENDSILMVMFGVLAYLLVLPRIQDYQFAIAIVPCFFIIQRANIPAPPLLFVLFVVQAVNIRLPALVQFYQLFFQYKLLLIVCLAWLLLLFSMVGSRWELLRPDRPGFNLRELSEQ